MVRLVKGAYWDTEIKAAQVAGLDDYPVFTRKVATDVSYLACAKRLLAASDVIYPAFATHNANTIGQVKALAGDRAFEFQRLHGMGEELYDELAKLERGDRRAAPPRCASTRRSEATRNCSPISSGGCSKTAPIQSFVNRIADEDVPIDELVRDPVAELGGADPQAQSGDPACPMRSSARRGRNSAGLDLSDPLVREPLLERLDALEARLWSAAPTLGGSGEGRPVVAPYRP